MWIHPKQRQTTILPKDIEMKQRTLAREAIEAVLIFLAMCAIFAPELYFAFR
jgi:hypothetical protein